jgi:hypothetical protein
MAPYLPFDIFGKCPKVSEWRSQLAKRDSVINAVKKDYPAKLLLFLRKRNSHFADLIAQREKIPAIGEQD